MKHLLITFFLSSSLLYANGNGSLSPETQNKLDAVIKAEKKMNQPPTTPVEKSAPSAEEKLSEKGPATPANSCDGLSTEEQLFVDSLGPIHKNIFCSKFSPNLKQLAMKMAGQRDAQGGLITPMRAVTIVASENDIPIPYVPREPLEDASKVLPQKGSP